jgi:hypothetical protein
MRQEPAFSREAVQFVFREIGFADWTDRCGPSLKPPRDATCCRDAHPESSGGLFSNRTERTCGVSKAWCKLLRNRCGTFQDSEVLSLADLSLSY